jgi:hypothetical protein
MIVCIKLLKVFHYFTFLLYGNVRAEYQIAERGNSEEDIRQLFFF